MLPEVLARGRSLRWRLTVNATPLVRKTTHTPTTARYPNETVNGRYRTVVGASHRKCPTTGRACSQRGMVVRTYFFGM